MSNACRIAVLAAALAWAATSTAGDIYVCKGAHGEKVYQNTACATPASQVGHNTYSNELSRAPAAPAYSDDAPIQRNAGPAAPAPQAPAYAPRAPDPAPIAAYQCTAGHRQWVQHTPCPTSYTTSAPVMVSGFTQYGTHVSGMGSVSQQAPVQQSALDHDTFCQQVRAGARLPGGGSSASQSYERNKIKRNECGG